MALYATTKYAVVGLSEGMRQDLAPHNIGVSAFCPDLVDTRLFEWGRNRPERFGGAIEGGGADEIKKVQVEGLAPDDAGKRLLAAIESNEFYVVTHPENRAQVEARHQTIMDAFDSLDDWRRQNGVDDAPAIVT